MGFAGSKDRDLQQTVERLSIAMLYLRWVRRDLTAADQVGTAEWAERLENELDGFIEELRDLRRKGVALPDTNIG